MTGKQVFNLLNSTANYTGKIVPSQIIVFLQKFWGLPLNIEDIDRLEDEYFKLLGTEPFEENFSL